MSSMQALPERRRVDRPVIHNIHHFPILVECARRVWVPGRGDVGPIDQIMYTYVWLLSTRNASTAWPHTQYSLLVFFLGRHTHTQSHFAHNRFPPLGLRSYAPYTHMHTGWRRDAQLENQIEGVWCGAVVRLFFRFWNIFLVSGLAVVPTWIFRSLCSFRSTFFSALASFTPVNGFAKQYSKAVTIFFLFCFVFLPKMLAFLFASHVCKYKSRNGNNRTREREQERAKARKKYIYCYLRLHLLAIQSKTIIVITYYLNKCIDDVCTRASSPAVAWRARASRLFGCGQLILGILCG